MRSETTACLIVGAAGTWSGVIAGLQHRVTPGAVLAISAVLAVAAAVASWILPPQVEPAE